MKKRVRVMSYKGRISLRWEFLDSEGEMINLSLDPVELVSKNSAEFMELLDEIAEARKLPIISVTAANKQLYFKVDLE